MPAAHVARFAHGEKALTELRERYKKDNVTEVRRRYVSGVNMLPDRVVPFLIQMAIYWSKMDARHKTEVIRFTITFDREELDPDSPEDSLKALEIGREIAKANTPDCQSAVFVDERDGKVEINILTNDVRMSNHKSVGLKVCARSRFQQLVDRAWAMMATAYA